MRGQQRLVAAAVVVVALAAFGELDDLLGSGTACRPGPATATLGLTPPPVGPQAESPLPSSPNLWASERLLVQDIQCFTYPHLGPGVSIYSEATIKGETRPVELVHPLPGRTSARSTWWPG